jgi:hypothetical protein
MTHFFLEVEGAEGSSIVVLPFQVLINLSLLLAVLGVPLVVQIVLSGEIPNNSDAKNEF